MPTEKGTKTKHLNFFLFVIYLSRKKNIIFKQKFGKNPTKTNFIGGFEILCEIILISCLLQQPQGEDMGTNYNLVYLYLQLFLLVMYM